MAGGVLIGLMVTAQPFSLINCGIGTIALAGIIVNNNIVLIDTYNKLRDAGMELREAILRTCALRLRPVLLTKITMILGLLPMAMRLNIDLLDGVILAGWRTGARVQVVFQRYGAIAGMPSCAGAPLNKTCFVGTIYVGHASRD